MFETNQFNLPLLQAAQSQKHVTVNEAIARLDAVAQLRFESIVQTQPSVTATDGECYFVPVQATGDWLGNDGMIAIYSNGGWVYVTPKIGWKAWVVEDSHEVVYTSLGWEPVGVITQSDPIASGNWGTSTKLIVVEHEQVITAGTIIETPNIIPDNAYVMAVLTRNIEDIITDGATTWKLGLSWDDDRYGIDRSLALNASDSSNVAQKIFYYRTANKLSLKPASGSFVSGKVRISVHCTVFEGPAVV